MKIRKGLTPEIVKMKADGKTYGEIATILGCTRQNIQQKFLPLRCQMIEVATRAQALCEQCGQFDQFGQFHHKTYDYDILNEPDNLLYLCTSCHMKLNVKSSGVYCLNCGLELIYKHRNRKFCSKECSMKYYLITCECSNCHKTFTLTRGKQIRVTASKSGLLFCSKKCQGIYVGKHFGFGAHPQNIKKGMG